jgi:hypothetical protein
VQAQTEEFFERTRLLSRLLLFRQQMIIQGLIGPERGGSWQRNWEQDMRAVPKVIGDDMTGRLGSGGIDRYRVFGKVGTLCLPGPSASLFIMIYIHSRMFCQAYSRPFLVHRQKPATLTMCLLFTGFGSIVLAKQCLPY